MMKHRTGEKEEEIHPLVGDGFVDNGNEHQIVCHTIQSVL